jgi:hypothetical protein
MADTREHTVIEKETTNDNGIVGEFIKVAPFISFVVLSCATFFNLQGQVIELRARYEASTSTTKESLADIRDDIKETNSLVRRLLDRDVPRQQALPPLIR